MATHYVIYHAYRFVPLLSLIAKVFSIEVIMQLFIYCPDLKVVTHYVTKS